MGQQLWDDLHILVLFGVLNYGVEKVTIMIMDTGPQELKSWLTLVDSQGRLALAISLMYPLFHICVFPMAWGNPS